MQMSWCSRPPFQKRAELQELMLRHTGNNKTWQSHALKMSETLSSGVQPYMLLWYAIFNYPIPFYEYSGSMWRQHQWKQAETMVALATLSLLSAKKLFQKGSLENKIWCMILTFVWSWRWYWSLFQNQPLRKSSVELTLICEAVWCEMIDTNI